jgi:hypothetical protein
MDVLIYNNLSYDKLKDKVTKVIALLQKGDFRSADVKKMSNTGYYRAKLDETNRLLFSIGAFGGKKYFYFGGDTQPRLRQIEIYAGAIG